MFAAVWVRLWKKGECPIPFLILCLTTLGSFAALFLADKLIGHKQMAQLDFFDYITGITIGSIAAEMATELEEPWKPLTAILIYGGRDGAPEHRHQQISQEPKISLWHIGDPDGPGNDLPGKSEESQAGSR